MFDIDPQSGKVFSALNFFVIPESDIVLQDLVSLKFQFSGKIFTASKLDREKTSEFNLIAISRDSDGLSCTSKVS